MAEPASDKSVKQFWQGVVDENMVMLRDSLLEAAQSTKLAWVSCSNCKHRMQAEIPDARARTDALKALHVLAGEMPKADQSASSGQAGFVLKRVLVMPDGRTVELKDGALSDDMKE